MAGKAKPAAPRRTGRAKPLMAKAGITRTHRRYKCGGKLKK